MLGRACSLRNKGLNSEALAVARDGLAILSRPFVARLRPVESSVLIGLTILTEELSKELNQSGASLNDLKDTLQCINQLPNSSAVEIQNMKAWVPYLQAKVGGVSNV